MGRARSGFRVDAASFLVAALRTYEVVDPGCIIIVVTTLTSSRLLTSVRCFGHIFGPGRDTPKSFHVVWSCHIAVVVQLAYIY